MSNENQVKIMIDAGHGGKDPGAIYNDLKEKNLVLDISFYQLDRFHDLGFQTVMTRYGDETLEPDERIKRINQFNPEYLISNHINAGGGEGAEVIHSVHQDGKLAKKVLDEIGKKGQKKRRIYFKQLHDNPARDYFFIHRRTKARALIVEYGFIDNEKDRLKIKDNLRKYADGVVNAFYQFINLH